MGEGYVPPEAAVEVALKLSLVEHLLKQAVRLRQKYFDHAEVDLVTELTDDSSEDDRLVFQYGNAVLINTLKAVVMHEEYWTHTEPPLQAAQKFLALSFLESLRTDNEAKCAELYAQIALDVDTEQEQDDMKQDDEACEESQRCHTCQQIDKAHDAWRQWLPSGPMETRMKQIIDALE